MISGQDTGLGVRRLVALEPNCCVTLCESLDLGVSVSALVLDLSGLLRL